MRPRLTVLVPSVLLLTCSALAAPGAPKTVWKPDPHLIPKLAPETTVDAYRLRPPGGYRHREIKRGQPLHAWEAPARKDGTHASLTLMVMHIPAQDPRTFAPEVVLDRFVSAVEQSRTNWTRIPTQHGDVNGLAFVRTRWVGTDKVTHRKMQGFQYVAVDGRSLIVMGSQDVDGQDTSLKLAEASVLTLRKAAAAPRSENTPQVRPAAYLAPESTPQRVPAKPRLGINLNGPADWNTELPFVDVFRFSRAWISQRPGADWGKGPQLALDTHGWITRLAPDCWAETPLCTINSGHYPAGEYTVLYDGQGTLEFTNAEVVSRAVGRIVVRPNPQHGGFFLRLMRTEPGDYVRNIRVIMPGFEKTYRTEPFRPGFLRQWQGVASLRFMDWMLTNGSQVKTWAERPHVEDATYTTKGIPVEVMVDLANRLKADPWFTLPHRADDDYVRRFARLVKQRLHPSLKVYLEYSNEVWNGQFEQSRWAGEEGRKLGFAEKPWEAGWRYTAYRSGQIFQLWEQEWGARSRLVRVLASQSANPYVSEQILTFRDAYKNADALAIAPYLSCNVSPTGKPSVAEAEGWSTDQALDYLEKTALPQSAGWITAQKAVADRFGLRLLAYEGGQHMVGVAGGENNERVTQVLQAANAHPRMGQIYGKYYDAWTRAGGDLFCYFSSVGEWSKWGSWGIMQHYDDDPKTSPKYVATMRWAHERGQAVNGP